MSTWILVSASEEEARLLTDAGPRRDFVELARATGGEVIHAPEGRGRGGLFRKLFGPHVRQAWRVAGRISRGDTVFADGEHNGIPLLLFLAMRWRRPRRVTMLGHLPGKWWKLAALWAGTRLVRDGVLIVHSSVQLERVERWLGGRWEARLVPYQVDTAFWAPGADSPGDNQPLVVAVGSEHRDYETLVDAVRGLPVDVVIAAGSYWARKTAAAAEIPANVTLITRPLPFAALRDLYARATAVVVPVHDVANQSGVTTILEAMSMARPVVTSASRGQREYVTGPLVLPDSNLDRGATADRGPAAWLPRSSAVPADTGLYVGPGDARALREAIRLLVENEGLRLRLGTAARRSVLRHFTIEHYTEALRAAMLGGAEPSTGGVGEPLEGRA
ncbi:MAG: hypothetical protein Kow0010_21520 [Dehalococcoidia bacterium]